MAKSKSDALLNFKLFRVVRDYDDNDHNEEINLARRIASGRQAKNLQDQYYSINELRKLGPKFIKDKVFESCLERGGGTMSSEASLISNSEFKFFQIQFCMIETASSYQDTDQKRPHADSFENESYSEALTAHDRLENSPLVIQIKDISGKLLYSEAKAQTRYVTMMQTSVSHELRNPTASIIYQLNNVREEIQ